MKNRPEMTDLPPSVEHFDKLPPEARLDGKAVRILFGINSYATFSRRRADGTIPAPDCPHGTWSVKTIRSLLEAKPRNQLRGSK